MHLHVITVKSMSQINHYQDESDYALKRIVMGKCNTLQINSVPNNMYHGFDLDNSSVIIFM
jgi:hypothetical protein